MPMDVGQTVWKLKLVSEYNANMSSNQSASEDLKAFVDRFVRAEQDQRVSDDTLVSVINILRMRLWI